jgi:hypothetical protein
MMNFEVGNPELADAIIAVGDEKASSWAKRGILMSSFSGPDYSLKCQWNDYQNSQDSGGQDWKPI